MGSRPVRRLPGGQWVLSVPFPLRWLFASEPQTIGPVLAIVHRVIGHWQAHQAGIARTGAQRGAVNQTQRIGSALNLNIHFDVHGRTNAADA
jgi:hypothetical protein